MFLPFSGHEGFIPRVEAFATLFLRPLPQRSLTSSVARTNMKLTDGSMYLFFTCPPIQNLPWLLCMCLTLHLTFLPLLFPHNSLIFIPPPSLHPHRPLSWRVLLHQHWVSVWIILKGCPTPSPWATCSPGQLWMRSNRKSLIYFKPFCFAHQFFFF